MDKFNLYKKTAERLARAGVKDPTSQIIFLADEIERYREKICGLEAVLRAGENPPNEKTDFIGMTWFPQFSKWQDLLEWIEVKGLEGWKPYRFEYEPGSLTDHTSLTIVLYREV